MKSLVLLLALAVVVVSGFAPIQVGRIASSTTSLAASRNRDKIASRTKWLESRGYGDGGAAAVAEADDDDEEEEDDDEDGDDGEEEGESEE